MGVWLSGHSPEASRGEIDFVVLAKHRTSQSLQRSSKGERVYKHFVNLVDHVPVCSTAFSTSATGSMALTL
jgi:hypothetical protein